MSRKSRNRKNSSRRRTEFRSKGGRQEFNFLQPFGGETHLDKEQGVIRGVSVITSGIQARGHDLEVDDRTVSQMLEAAESMGKVPVKWNHKTGADAVNGYLENFSVVGNKLKADWHLLQSHSQYGHAIELAERMPTGVGLSASFTGTPEKKAGKTFARCDELVSVDLVANPAANPSGLFSSKVDTSDSGMDQETEIGEEEASSEVSNAEILKVLNSINERVQDIEDFNGELRESLEDDGADDIDSEDDSEDAEAEYDDGYGDENEGEYADAGVSGEAAEAFNTILRRVHHLEAHLEGKAQAEEAAENAHAFAVVQGKIEALIELNDQLAGENQALIEFRDNATRAQRNGGAVATHFSQDGSPVTNPNATDFEKKCLELEKGGKSKTEAISLAMGDRNLYERHLEAKSIINTL